MSAQHAIALGNQRVAKQLWVSIALASLLPICVAIYLVYALTSSARPSAGEAAMLLGFSTLFSVLGSYLVFAVARKVRTVSERAIKVAVPDLSLRPEGGDEIGQLDTAIDRFTQQLQRSMVELHQKAAELSQAKKQLELANEQLQRVDKTKSDFLRFISHEFRSPLMCVQMSLHSLLEEPEPGLAEAQEKYIKMALRSSERQLRLIDQMIDLTKLRQSRPSFPKQELDMSQVVHRMLGDLEHQFDQKHIQVHANGSESPAPVRADPESLETALRHVFHNVLEHTPEEGTTKIRVNVDKENVELMVEDSGPRFVERKFGELFEGLVRQYEDNDPRWRNDVLGLTLAKEIIALQGGSLEIARDDAQTGRLSIRLPKGTKP